MNDRAKQIMDNINGAASAIGPMAQRVYNILLAEAGNQIIAIEKIIEESDSEEIGIQGYKAIADLRMSAVHLGMTATIAINSAVLGSLPLMPQGIPSTPERDKDNQTAP